MTTEPETRTTARLLVRGFNNHIRDHGPDGDYAGEPIETSDGHGFIVSRDGAPFAVRVERSPLGAASKPASSLAADWTALRKAVSDERAARKEATAGDVSWDFLNRCHGWDDALGFVLSMMDALEKAAAPSAANPAPAGEE